MISIKIHPNLQICFFIRKQYLPKNRLQKSLGGRVRLLSIGAAAIDAKVVEACRVIFGSVIVESLWKKC